MFDHEKNELSCIQSVKKVLVLMNFCFIAFCLSGCCYKNKDNSCSKKQSDNLSNLNEIKIEQMKEGDLILMSRIYLSQILLAAKNELLQNSNNFSINTKNGVITFVGETHPAHGEYTYWMLGAQIPGIVTLFFKDSKIKRIEFRAGIPHMPMPDFDCDFKGFEDVEEAAFQCASQQTNMEVQPARKP